MLNPPVKHAVLGVVYPYPAMETMADRIKSLRVARGMTQDQLARACGVTKSAVSQWESGSTANIKLAVFLSLCETLKTDTEYLVWGPDRKPGGGAASKRHSA